MRILLHLCCAPCSAYSIKALREEGHDLLGLFYNPNIHPFGEYQLRRSAMERYGQEVKIPLIWEEGGGIESFFRAVAFHEEDRCRLCYRLRLCQAADAARAEGCEGFSTTLLVSPYQQHDLIREMGSEAAEEKGIPFIYRDLRPGWTWSRQEAKRIGLYRQIYCGCLFSERERQWEQWGRKDRWLASIPSESS